MSIHNLKKREDFNTIAIKTLKEYLRLVYKEDFKIKFDANRNTKDIKNRYYIFSRINAIVQTPFSPKIKKFIIKENSNSSNILKRIVGYLYLRVLTKLGGLLSDSSLTITPQIPGNNEILIYPGNKKFKIINFTDGYIDNIVKKSFPNEWFMKEIMFRKESRYDFVLPIIENNSNFYREEYVKGSSLPRVKKDKLNIYKTVNMYLDDMQNSDLKEIDTKNFLSNTVSTITDSTQILSSKKISKETIQGLMKFTKQLCKIIDTCNVNIFESFSHGDLQPGNVIVRDSDKKVFIIDWETWGIRSIWYDRMMLNYNLRNIYKLSENLMFFLKTDGKLLGDIFGGNLKSLGFNAKSMAALFLLEDIIWQLEETKALPDEIIGINMGYYLKESFQNELVRILDGNNV
jgi:thiamine kinase-like enzyme